jgi:phosphoinositide-3-kinase, regulatory subunit 4
MIKQMIQVDPVNRPTFDSLLHASRGTVFPECFYSFLHNYVASVNELSDRALFNPPQNQQPSNTPTFSSAPTTGTSNVRSGGTGTADDPINVFPSDSDHRIERIWEEYASLEPYLLADEVSETPKLSADVKVDYLSSAPTSQPFQVCDTYPVEMFVVDFVCRMYYLSSSTYQIMNAAFLAWLNSQDMQ